MLLLSHICWGICLRSGKGRSGKSQLGKRQSGKRRSAFRIKTCFRFFAKNTSKSQNCEKKSLFLNLNLHFYIWLKLTYRKVQLVDVDLVLNEFILELSPLCWIIGWVYQSCTTFMKTVLNRIYFALNFIDSTETR